jgi:hypothetical protein
MQSKSEVLLVLLLLHLYESFHLHICGVTKEKRVWRRFGAINFNIIFATVHCLRYFSSTALQKSDMSYWSRLTLSGGPSWAWNVAPLHVITETHPIYEAFVLKNYFYVQLPELHSLLIYSTMHYSKDNHYILWKVQFETSLKIYWLYHPLLSPPSDACVQQETMKAQQLHSHT